MVNVNVEASYDSGIKPWSITNVGTLINHQLLLVLSVITVQRVAVRLLTCLIRGLTVMTMMINQTVLMMY